MNHHGSSMFQACGSDEALNQLVLSSEPQLATGDNEGTLRPFLLSPAMQNTWHTTSSHYCVAFKLESE